MGASQGFLRHTLSLYHSTKPEEWRFQRQPNGRPSLHPGLFPKGCPLDFNVSHSGRTIAIAVSPGVLVGVDVEKRVERSVVAKLAELVLTPEERTYVWNGADDREVECRFTTLWTLKEAYLKALGCGLGGGVEWVCFDLHGGGIRLVQPSPLDGNPARWTFDLRQEGDIHFAVAIADRPDPPGKIQWMGSPFDPLSRITEEEP